MKGCRDREGSVHCVVGRGRPQREAAEGRARASEARDEGRGTSEQHDMGGTGGSHGPGAAPKGRVTCVVCGMWGGPIVALSTVTIAGNTSVRHPLSPT